MVLMNIKQVDGLVIAASCAAAGVIIGASVGYIIGHDDGVKETTEELLDFVNMLESEDNSLSATTQKASKRLKERSAKKLEDSSFDFREVVRALGAQTKKALIQAPIS